VCPFFLFPHLQGHFLLLSLAPLKLIIKHPFLLYKVVSSRLTLVPGLRMMNPLPPPLRRKHHRLFFVHMVLSGLGLPSCDVMGMAFSFFFFFFLQPYVTVKILSLLLLRWCLMIAFLPFVIIKCQRRSPRTSKLVRGGPSNKPLPLSPQKRTMFII